ncbi:MAG: Wzz/FepE/Etk N-terminal domain-containing protein [Fusobacterium sp. JB019]|nr:Wzz/FepE/Etk N-terminal domain-containing protein [Fusobacterium sp. JB019]
MEKGKKINRNYGYNQSYEGYYDNPEEDEIDLVDLIFVMIRRWKLIVLTIIPVIIIGFFFALTRPSVYQAETTLMVSSGMASVGIDNSDISLNQKLVITYSEVAKSKSILRRVINKYDLETTPENLAGAISISPVSDTEIIKLSYKNGDPQLAASVTNEFAKEFMNKVVEVMNIRNVKVVEPAEIPTHALPKKRAIILAAFVILGVMLGMGLAFIVESIHKKLRKPSEIESILGAPMLGMIPKFEDNSDKNEEDTDGEN